MNRYEKLSRNPHLIVLEAALGIGVFLFLIFLAF